MTSVYQRLKTWLAIRLSAPETIANSPQPARPNDQDDHENAQHLVPYDENLLERSRTQWQLGDWVSLAAISRDTLQHHPDRAKLALLVAAGHQALGNAAEARHHTRMAIEWGCSKKLVSQILIAGVHNTLGRVAAISGKQGKMEGHFRLAVSSGTPGLDSPLLAQTRTMLELGKLRLSTIHADNENSYVQLIQKVKLGSISKGSAQSQMSDLLRNSAAPCSAAVLDGQLIGRVKPEAVSVIGLGNAWAGNTVNTVIFRHHGILTQKAHQFTAFYVDKNILRLVQRDLNTNAVQTCDLVGEYNLNDAHNTISLGLDRAGYLHMCYDHHGTQLRYRRSTQPLNIQRWTDELQMTGQHEGKVTYPCFVQPHQKCDDRPLLLLYRDGAWNKGSARLKTYDEATQTWEDRPAPILSGTDQKPWTSNAYWNHPAVGADGSLHLSFVWRTDSLGHEQRINNINVCYATSMDWGVNWVTSLGQPYCLPITQVNTETVHPVSPGSNLINQCGMALDSLHRPHIVFYSDDKNGIPQYQHLWFDGKEWHHQFISNRTEAFSLQGGGTLQIPISRPEIVIDRQDNAYVVYRGDLSHNRMVATLLPAPDYRFDPANTQILWDEDLGYSEPVIDRIRWGRDNILTLLLQHNQQPNYDIGHEQIDRSVTLVDIYFH